MGGGSGTIIVTNKRLVINQPLTDEDEAELNEIAARSPAGCSHADTFRVLAIIWKYLRP